MWWNLPTKVRVFDSWGLYFSFFIYYNMIEIILSALDWRVLRYCVVFLNHKNFQVNLSKMFIEMVCVLRGSLYSQRWSWAGPNTRAFFSTIRKWSLEKSTVKKKKKDVKGNVKRKKEEKLHTRALLEQQSFHRYMDYSLHSIKYVVLRFKIYLKNVVLLNLTFDVFAACRHVKVN